MDSFTRKITLSLFLSLVFFTLVASVWLPKYLEQSEGNAIKGLEPAPKVDVGDGTLAGVVTRFPTRPFQSRPKLPSRIAEDVSTDSTTDGDPQGSSGLGGLPTRSVPGVNDSEPVGDRVTTRAYLRSNSSVFARPQTTAAVLGRVGTLTKVRWLAKAGENWEEILLKDGRSAYVQSDNMSFSSDTWSTHKTGFDSQQKNSRDPDLATLPGTVETFLGHLSSGDLLRAETYLSPLATRLDNATLSSLAPYVGAPALGRVLRIELVSGDRGTYRRVRIVYGDEMAHEVRTLWEWDMSQQRWMLVRWD